MIEQPKHTPGPWSDSAASALLIQDLLEALKAQERADWALRNFEAVSSDPLHPNIQALKLEMLKTRSDASILRKAAIAKAEGRAE